SPIAQFRKALPGIRSRSGPVIEKESAIVLRARNDPPGAEAAGGPIELCDAIPLVPRVPALGVVACSAGRRDVIGHEDAAVVAEIDRSIAVLSVFRMGNDDVMVRMYRMRG